MTGLQGCVNAVGQPRFHAAVILSDERFTVVLHGNIHNAAALCEGLPAQHNPHEAADALLCLWRHKGCTCLPELDGAFALAVWDAQERTLTLVRDRFGQKPLYYALQKDSFSFASDAVSIAPRPLQPEKNALFHYLTVQSVPAPLCAFEGVCALPHGHALTWRAGQEPQVQRYWTPAFTHSFVGTLDDAASELELLLTASMRRSALGCHGGALLSGGVDSSLMVALLCGLGHRPDTFAMGFKEQSFDERPFAQEVAQLFGTKHQELTCSNHLPTLIDTLVASFGTPFADSSALPTWLSLQAVRDAGCSTAVLGDGGDDFFAGYERHLNPFLYSTDDTEDQRAALLRTELDSCPQYSSLAASIGGSSAKFYTHWARFWGPLKNDVCGEALRKAGEPPASVLLARHIFQHKTAHNLLDSIQIFELDYYLPCTLTAKVEVPARACGIYTAAPFVCNDILNFALSMPTDFRVGKGEGTGSFGCGYETKRVVKRLAERYLPREIVYRRKMGFGVPLAQWLRGPLRELLCDTLLTKTCAERGWLVPRTVEYLVNEHMQGVRDWHYPLWTLLMLELWAQKILDAQGLGVQR